jgi:hypothetical protein
MVPISRRLWLTFKSALFSFFIVASIRSALAQANDLSSVLAEQSIKFLVFGELHGTTEEPRAFGDAVAAAMRSRQLVTVALELSVDEQASITSYINSDGNANDRRALLAGSDWRENDGRTSAAMFRLIEQLRILSHEYRDRIKVIAIKPTFNPKDRSQTGYEEEMAKNLLKAAPADSDDSVVIALVGNIHAMRTPIESDPAEGFVGFLPMAMHLPQKATVTVRMNSDGGEAWNCMDNAKGVETCGAHIFGPEGGAHRADFLVFRLPRNGYNAALWVGHLSASPPASSAKKN